MTKKRYVSVTSERIKMLRLQAGITQKEMGEIVGTSNSSICAYENGDTKLDVDTLKIYAEYFHVSADFLVGTDHNDSQATVSLFSNSETEMLMRYRHKSKREKKIMRLMSMSDDEYDRTVSGRADPDVQILLADDEDEYTAEEKKDKPRQKKQNKKK